MGKIVVTCVLALVFGFGGAAGAIAAFHDQLQGAQGPTGLTGPPGAVGPAGQDGTDGTNGTRGAPGKVGTAGKPGKAASKPPLPVTDLGTTACAGRSIQVVTRANLTAQQRLVVGTKRVCIVTPSTQ